MKIKKQRTPEIAWPIGPDGTYQASVTDPFGMYTGLPDNPFEVPVQDADDL